MPVIKSAIKKLRKDIKRTKANDSIRDNLDRAINAAKRTKTSKTVTDAMSLVDRAVGKKLLHKNKAARIKSSLSKLAKPTVGTAKPKSKTKPAAATKATKSAAKPEVKKSAKPSKKTK